MRGEQPFYAFNRGMLSRLAMARTDLKRYGMSAEEQTNFMPRVLGSAMLRPGMAYLGETKNNAVAKYLDFVFSATDTAMLELTASIMRVWVNDALVTRPTVGATFANGNFDTNLASWTDIDAGVSVSQWVTGGYMGLTSDGTNKAGRRQAVTIGASYYNVVHGIRIVVSRGSIELVVGASAGADTYMRVTLGAGTHSLAFTPTGDISVDILSATSYESLVDSIAFDAAGTLELPTPWGSGDLSMIRKDQSGDVLFVACDTKQQRKIERRGTTSWSVALYEPENGPFRPINTSATTLSNNAIRGYTTLTASLPVFESSHVGALFRMESDGQYTSKDFTAENQFGDKIVVTGTGTARGFTVNRTGGPFVATITLQRSVGDTEVWEDTTNTYTTLGAVHIVDGLDNQIVAYRLAIKTGDYTSGSVVGDLDHRFGSITGIVRITAVTNSTTATAVVLKTLGSANRTTTNWYEGAWSNKRGWPTAVSLYEGRLWWAGKDKWYGSVSDDFSNFDPDYEGDAAPIGRSIGSGPVDVINWLLPLQRLMAGCDSSVIAGRSSSFDEPLTPTNFNPKVAVTQGSARIQALKVDDTGVFVQRGGYRIFSMVPSLEATTTYKLDNLSALVPEIGKPGITALATQRQPDTRLHCVRSDGKVAVMIYDATEDVRCWILVETDGSVEDVIVMPGASGEEAVYYVVQRTINGATKRYLEKWAREDECIGGSTSKLADSFVTYNGSNLTHLNGKSVVGWHNGVAYPAVVVSAGVATGMPTGAIVGLSYEARFKSTRLAYIAQPGESGLPSRKRACTLALILADTDALGILYGRNFTDMDNLPLMEGYEEVAANTVHTDYNREAFSFPGSWGVDERLCLKAAAPRPATILGAIVGMASHSTT